MAKFHLIPIVLGAAIGVGVYVVSKYLAQDEESEQIVDDSAFDDSEASESTEDADETEEKCRRGTHRRRTGGRACPGRGTARTD